MRKWLENNEPWIRLAYRIAVVALLVWVARLINQSDTGWQLSEIIDLLRRR